LSANSWHGNDPVKIQDLAALDFTILRLVISGGKKFANRRDAGTAMDSADDFIGIEAVPPRPFGPDARHDGSRVDQHAIHIEQERFAANFRHGHRIVRKSGVCEEQELHAKQKLPRSNIRAPMESTANSFAKTAADVESAQPGGWRREKPQLSASIRHEAGRRLKNKPRMEKTCVYSVQGNMKKVATQANVSISTVSRGSTKAATPHRTFERPCSER
jgi:hypothetical protein